MTRQLEGQSPTRLILQQPQKPSLNSYQSTRLSAISVLFCRRHIITAQLRLLAWQQPQAQSINVTASCNVCSEESVRYKLCQIQFKSYIVHQIIRGKGKKEVLRFLFVQIRCASDQLLHMAYMEGIYCLCASQIDVWASNWKRNNIKTKNYTLKHMATRYQLFVVPENILCCFTRGYQTTEFTNGKV